MPVRMPDEEEQSHSVAQKQAPRPYPTQGSKHRHLYDAQLPWVISSHPYGLAGCHKTPQTPISFPQARTRVFSSHPRSFAFTRHNHGGQGAPAAMPHPAPFTQPCSSMAASPLQPPRCCPTLHPHVPPLLILPSPPALVQTFPLPLSSSSM